MRFQKYFGMLLSSVCLSISPIYNIFTYAYIYIYIYIYLCTSNNDREKSRVSCCLRNNLQPNELQRLLLSNLFAKE